MLKESGRSASIDKLKGWVLGGKTTITQDELTSEFHAKDFCQRGPTLLGDAGITNDGPRECHIRTELSNLNITVQLNMPKHFEANWNTHAPTMKLSFSDPNNAPSLLFLKGETEEQDPINDNFGGAVQWLEADSNRLFARVPHGCVGIIYKEPHQ